MKSRYVRSTQPRHMTAGTMKRLLLVAAILSTCIQGSSAKDKPIDWQPAKVLDISSERIGEGGLHQVGGTVIGPGSGNIWRDKGITYTIQTADFTYTASEFSMAHHKLKPERVKTGPVKISVKSDKVLVLLGDDGKSYNLQIMRRSHQ